MLDNKEIVISITKAAKYKLAKDNIIHDEDLLEHVKNIKFSTRVSSKPGLYVVLAARNGHIPFWIMTYYDPTETPIDLCDISVSTLINIWEKDGIDAAMTAFEDGQIDSAINSYFKNNGTESNSISLIDLSDW